MDPSTDPSPHAIPPEHIDRLFLRWTELTDLYTVQLGLWEHGDLDAFQSALDLAPKIEHLRRLISGEPLSGQRLYPVLQDAASDYTRTASRG